MRPLCTLPFGSTMWRPVMPRKVRLARSNPPRTASSKPLEDAAVILLTRATLMSSSLSSEGPNGPSSIMTWGRVGTLCKRRRLGREANSRYGVSSRGGERCCRRRDAERGKRLLRRGAPGEVAAMRGREVIGRACLAGEEQPVVDRARQDRPIAGMAGQRVGIGAAGERIAPPGRGGEGLQALADGIAEDAGKLVPRASGHPRLAVALERHRELAAEIARDHRPALRAELVASGGGP